MHKPKGNKKERIKINLISNIRRSIIIEKEPWVLRRTNTKGLKNPSAHTIREGIIQRTCV